MCTCAGEHPTLGVWTRRLMVYHPGGVPSLFLRGSLAARSSRIKWQYERVIGSGHHISEINVRKKGGASSDDDYNDVMMWWKWRSIAFRLMDDHWWMLWLTTSMNSTSPQSSSSPPSSPPPCHPLHLAEHYRDCDYHRGIQTLKANALIRCAYALRQSPLRIWWSYIDITARCRNDTLLQMASWILRNLQFNRPAY